MPIAQYIPPINTLDQKLQIQRRLGGLKSCKYFNLLTMYLNMKVTKPDFDKLCIALIGRENVPLHNHFLKSIVKKACLSKAAPPRPNTAADPLKVKMPNGCNGLPPIGKNSRKCRTPNLRDSRFRHRPSPLGPHEKNSSTGLENSTSVVQEHQIDIDKHPVGNSLHVSVEHREEVNPDSESLSISKRSPITSQSTEHQKDTDPRPVGNEFHVPVEHREEVNRDPERLAINRRSPIRAPLGPHEKNNAIGNENSTPKSDLHPVGNGFHVSVEHREEVNRESVGLAINRRTPIRAPLGPHEKNNAIGNENSTPKSDLHPVGNGFHVSVEHREEVNRESVGLAINRRTPMQAPLGPHVKNNSIGFENSTPKLQEHPMDTDLHPVRKRPHLLVEHREEVNRDSEGLAINRRTPMRAPLGPHVKNNSIEFENSTPKFQEHQMDTDLHPLRKRPHLSVEHREEVNRDSERLAVNRSTPMRAPLGPHVKNNSIGFTNSTPNFQEQQINTDLHPVMSVEHREEVNRDSEKLAINRTPIRAPLGLPTYDNRAQIFKHQGLQSGIVTDTCQSIGHLPDTYSLMKRMQHKGCNISADAAKILNTALDVYLKRLIKPCLNIEASMSVNKFGSQIQPGINSQIQPAINSQIQPAINSQIQPGINQLPRNRRVQKLLGSVSASVPNLRTAMELNPTILGEDWPQHVERTSILTFGK